MLEIIVYARRTTNEYVLSPLSYEGWVSLIKFMMGPTIKRKVDVFMMLWE